jgi:hypothetical protein
MKSDAAYLAHFMTTLPIFMGGVGLGVFGGACMAHKNASGARFPHTGFQKLGTITLIGTTGVSLGLLTGSICYHAIDEIVDSKPIATRFRISRLITGAAVAGVALSVWGLRRQQR